MCKALEDISTVFYYTVSHLYLPSPAKSNNAQSLKKAEGGNTVVTDNLLAYLYDEDTMLGSISEIKPSSDALVGAGVAAGVVAGAAAIGSLFNGGGGGGGSGGGSRSRTRERETVFQ